MTTTEWTVEFTLRNLPHEDTLVDIQETLDGKGIDASVAALPSAGQWTVSFGTAAKDFAHAVNQVHENFERFVGGKLRLDEIIAVNAMTLDEQERRAEEPTMPTLVGASEVAEILHVSRQRVHQLREHDGFPEPLVEVAMGPLWDERAVDKFDREWARKPGRPAAEA